MPLPVKRSYKLLTKIESSESSSESDDAELEDECDSPTAVDIDEASPERCSPSHEFATSAPVSFTGSESGDNEYPNRDVSHPFQTSYITQPKPVVPLPSKTSDPPFRKAHGARGGSKSNKITRSCLKKTISIKKFVELVECLDYDGLSCITSIPLQYFMPNFEDGETILHKLVVVNEPATIQIMRLLVERFKAPINLISYDGEPLLNAAVRAAKHDSIGHWQNEMIHCLIELNCDVNLEATNGERPLFVAYEMGNLEAAVLLVKRGANPANVVAFEHRLINKSVPMKLREMIRDRFIDLNSFMFTSRFIVNQLYAHLIPASVTVFPMNPGANFSIRFTFDSKESSVSETNTVYLLEVRTIDPSQYNGSGTMMEFGERRDNLGLSASSEKIVASAMAHGQPLHLFYSKINTFDVTTVLLSRPAVVGRGKRIFIAELKLAAKLPPGHHFMAAVTRYQKPMTSF